MSKKNILPKHSLKTFVCPHCRILSTMSYNCISYINGEFYGLNENSPQSKDVVWIAICQSCKKKVIWVNEECIYPDFIYEVAHEDMPQSVKKIYNEAGSIYQRSPRAACALLRLAIELLCDELQAAGDNLDKKIGSLVKRGLAPHIQKALDILRVTGNKAIHHGKIAIDIDDKETAIALMRMLNIIVENVISNHQSIDDWYEKLPEMVKKKIEGRN